MKNVESENATVCSCQRYTITTSSWSCTIWPLNGKFTIRNMLFEMCFFSSSLVCVFVYEKKSKWQNSNENYTGNHINYTRIYRQILNFMGRLFFKVVAVGDTIPRNKTIHSQAFQCEKRIFFYWRQRNENKASKLVCNQKILFSLNSGGLFDFLYLLFFFILEKFLNGSCLILKLILLPPHYGKSTFKKSL